MCFGCSKEPSHRDGSFEYPQHMFWLKNKKNNFPLRTRIWGPDFINFLSSVNLLLQLDYLFFASWLIFHTFIDSC